MNKILMALAIATTVATSAEAQTTEVCRRNVANNKTSCYDTRYAQNFKVCKDDAGYHICGEIPGPTNSTISPVPIETGHRPYAMTLANAAMPVAAAPQNQPYPNTSMDISKASSYGGYYPERKGRIKACYTGNNVAELNRAPYEGCDSPQYDGVEANRERNKNVNNNVE